MTERAKHLSDARAELSAALDELTKLQEALDEAKDAERTASSRATSALNARNEARKRFDAANAALTKLLDNGGR